MVVLKFVQKSDASDLFLILTLRWSVLLSRFLFFSCNLGGTRIPCEALYYTHNG